MCCSTKVTRSVIRVLGHLDAHRLRRLAFPFDDAAEATSLEIYHVDHGQYETASPIRALIPFDGGRSVVEMVRL